MKLKERFYDKPDPNTISLINSIKQNPNFLKLVAFSLNCLYNQMYLPNTKHRDNSIYLFKEAFHLLAKVIDIHKTSDIIVQHGSGCFNRMIGLHKFRDDYISRCVIDSDLITTLNDAMHRQLTLDCIKHLLDFFSNLTLMQQYSGSLAHALPGLLKIVHVSKPPYGEVRKVFDLEYRLLVQFVVIECVDAHLMATTLVELLLEFPENVFIVRESLKLLLLLIRHEGCLRAILKKQSIPVKILSEILLQHNDNDINEKGAKVLEKVISQADIDSALKSIETMDQQAEFSMGLIACLIPAIYQRIKIDDYLSLMQGLIANWKKIYKRKPILRDALLSLSRLADMDKAYSDKLQAFLKQSLDLFECDDQDVAAAAMELGRKIGLNQSVESMVLMIEKALKMLGDLKSVKECLKLILSLGPMNETTLKATTKGKEVFLKIAEQTNLPQICQVYNAKAMMLIRNECKDYFIKKQQIIHNQIARQQKKAALQYLILLNAMASVNKSQQLILGIVSMLYGKDFVGILNSLKNKQDSDDEEDDPEDEFVDEQTDLKLIGEQGELLLQTVLKQEDNQAFFKELNEEWGKFVKKQEELGGLMVEICLVKFAFTSSVYQQQYQRIKEIQFELTKLGYQYKKDILLALVFLLKKIKEFNKESSQVTFDLILQLLENEEIIQSTLLALKQIGSNATLVVEDQNAINLIAALQIYMKKYLQNEIVQKGILDVISAFLQFPAFKKHLKDLPKILCRKLPDDNTTKECGLTTIQILQDVEFTENALKYTSLFQAEHQHDIDVLQQLSPYVQFVGKYEGDAYLTDEVKKEIMEMILYLQDMEDPHIGSQYLDRLSVHAMVDQALDYEIELSIEEVLEPILKYTLLEEKSEGLLCSAIIIYTRILTKSQKKVQIELALKNLHLVRHSRNPTQLIVEYLYKCGCRKLSGEADVQLFLDILEEYNSEQGLQYNVRQILFRCCLESQEVSRQIGNQRFISRLISQTREELIERVNEINMEWLIVLSKFASDVIILEGGIQLCNQIIKQFNHPVAFQLLQGLADAGSSIPFDFVKSYIHSHTLDVLNVLFSLLKSKDYRESLEKQSAQALIEPFKHTYPEQVEKVLMLLNASDEVPTQAENPEKAEDFTIGQIEQIEQQNQDLVQNEEIPLNQSIMELVQEEQVDHNAVIEQCLLLIQQNPQQVVDEGILEKLGGVPKEQVWGLYNKLIENPEIAQQLLQPGGKIYEETLQQLSSGENAALVFITAGQLSGIADSLEQFAQSDGPTNMLTIMDKQIENPEVVSNGLSAFNKLVKEESILYQLGDGNGIEVSKQVLERYGDNAGMVIECNTLLNNLSVSETYQDKMAELGIIDKLIQQIKENKDKPDVIESSVFALAKIVYRNNENSERVLQSGVLDDIVQLDCDLAFTELLNNMVYKNEEMKSKMRVDYLVRMFEKNLVKFNSKAFNECVNSLFNLASSVQNVKRMVELGIVVMISKFLVGEHPEEMLQTLNLLLKIVSQVLVDGNLEIVRGLLEAIMLEKLEKPALRILKVMKVLPYFNEAEGQKAILRVLKRQDKSACQQCLEIILKLDQEAWQNFEAASLGLELEDLLKQFSKDLKLFPLVLEICSKIKCSNSLVGQLVMFAQQNELTDEQIKKILCLITEETEGVLPFLLGLEEKYLGLVAQILVKQAKKSPNIVYVNKCIEFAVEKIADHPKHDEQITGNLIQVVFEVAKSLEEYRQEFAAKYLGDLERVPNPQLQALLDFLRGPKKRISRLTEEIKQFLTRGEILKMYKEDGSRGYYRIFCDETLQEIRWRPDKVKEVKAKWKLRTDQIKSVLGDYDKTRFEQSAFNNLSWFAKTINKLKNKQIEMKKCFSVFTTIKVKSYNALCKTESQKQKWLEYLDILMEEAQAAKS